jgi:hypothetical protein
MSIALHYVKKNDLSQLHDELIAAIPSLAPTPKGPVMAVEGLGDDIYLTVPDGTDEQAVAAVVDAHVPSPRIVDLAAAFTVGEKLRTTDAQPHEIYRLPLLLTSVYQATFTITGIDAANGVTKMLEGRFGYKRLLGGAVQVGAIVVISDIHDAAAASWAPNASPSGNDVVFTVAGAAGRTIDWLLVGTVGRYSPQGTGG